MPSNRKLSHDDYTVAWICALPVEMAAAQFMLDEVHEDLPTSSHDHNSYTLGRIGKHNVVIAGLPHGRYGNTSATEVVRDLLASFDSIRFGLMVGIGGGIPNNNADIRLGDIVVSKPTGAYGGVVQYDYGKALKGCFARTGGHYMGTRVPIQFWTPGVPNITIGCCYIWELIYGHPVVHEPL